MAGQLVALTRAVSLGLTQCELTHLCRVSIDVGRATAQHDEYEHVLSALGCQVERLGTDDSMPDSVFIEDTALVLDELAIVTRPGAETRRRETEEVQRALTPYRRVVAMSAPDTMDGGDVIVLGKTVVVGLSSRTNQSAVDTLRRLAAPFGYEVRTAEVTGCLHLKSAATAIADDAVLINRHWVSPEVFKGCRLVDVDPVPGVRDHGHRGMRQLPGHGGRVRRPDSPVLCVVLTWPARLTGL